MRSVGNLTLAFGGGKKNLTSLKFSQDAKSPELVKQNQEVSYSSSLHLNYSSFHNPNKHGRLSLRTVKRRRPNTASPQSVDHLARFDQLQSIFFT